MGLYKHFFEKHIYLIRSLKMSEFEGESEEIEEIEKVIEEVTEEVDQIRQAVQEMSFEPETIEKVRKLSLNAALSEVNVDESESRIPSSPSPPPSNPSPDGLLEDVIDEPPEFQSSEALIRSQYVDVTSSSIVPNLHIPVREEIAAEVAQLETEIEAVISTNALEKINQDVSDLVAWCNGKLPDDCQVKNLGGDFRDPIIYCSLLETIRMEAEKKGIDVPDDSDDIEPFEYCQAHLNQFATECNDLNILQSPNDLFGGFEVLNAAVVSMLITYYDKQVAALPDVDAASDDAARYDAPESVPSSPSDIADEDITADQPRGFSVPEIPAARGPRPDFDPEPEPSKPAPACPVPTKPKETEQVLSASGCPVSKCPSLDLVLLASILLVL